MRERLITAVWKFRNNVFSAIKSQSIRSDPSHSEGFLKAYCTTRMAKLENKDLTIIDIPDEVKLCDYYHGNIPRVDAEQSLRTTGEFLLRKAQSADGALLVVSVRKDDSFFHVPVSIDKENKYYFEVIKSAGIIELINSHIGTQTAITQKSGAILAKPALKSIWLINHEQLILLKKLGAGAYGEVFLGRMTDPTSEFMFDCAVKTMKQEASMEARLRFMKEARMMRMSYQHKHVVMIFGIAVQHHPLLIIMELCPNGSLLSHLRKNKGTIAAGEKLRFVVESASGLAYLERMNCIHRDIAARNCLLSAKNEIKISDFGLADDKFLVIDQSLEKLPIKWLAPETMQEKIYSSKSDIWAFGVMVWEIFADGEEPYPGLNNVQTRAKIVVQDYRMKMPDETPPEVTEVVQKCWDKNADARGTMSEHHQVLTKFMEEKHPIVKKIIANVMSYFS